MTDHPITPPPELVKQWAISSPIQHSDELWVYELFIARQAARWGADQELEASCEWLRNDGLFETRIGHLRTVRRPKPPSLKEQALEILKYPKDFWSQEEVDTIRRALEQLND
jgi:hypothetical protein